MFGKDCDFIIGDSIVNGGGDYCLNLCNLGMIIVDGVNYKMDIREVGVNICDLIDGIFYVFKEKKIMIYVLL